MSYCHPALCGVRGTPSCVGPRLIQPASALVLVGRPAADWPTTATDRKTPGLLDVGMLDKRSRLGPLYP